MRVPLTSDLFDVAKSWLKSAAVSGVFYARVVGIPSPTSRPRVAKFGTYYAKSYQIWMAECQRQLAEQLPEGGPLTGPLTVLVDIVVARPKTSKLTMPRGDVDNYAKAPLDAATKAAVWGDDTAIRNLIIRKRWVQPGEEPGAYLTIGVTGHG